MSKDLLIWHDRRQFVLDNNTLSSEDYLGVCVLPYQAPPVPVIVFDWLESIEVLDNIFVSRVSENEGGHLTFATFINWIMSAADSFTFERSRI